MSGGGVTIHPTDQYFHKESECQVECIIIHDDQDIEEDVLFINVGYSSVSSQTDPEDFNSVHSNSVPAIPMLYCGQPAPGIATTQCLIPCLSDACVGTEPADTSTGTGHYQGTLVTHTPLTSTSSTGVPPPSTAGHVVKSQTVTVIKNEGRRLEKTSSEVSLGTSVAKTKAVTRSLSDRTLKKRGRKRKVPHDKEEKRTPPSSLPAVPSKTSVKRRRKRRKKRDDDFEYDLGDSEDVDHILNGDDSDDDDEWRTEKVSDDNDDDSDDENDERFTNNIPQTNLKNNDVKDGDSDSEMLRKSTNNNANDKSRVVLTVGINDLDSESNGTCTQLTKYSEKAKQRYHQERIVKEDGKVMYRCLKCNEEFELRVHLKNHRKVHVGKVKVYECNHCDKVFSEARKYYSHLGLHKRIFKCQVCDRRFSLLGNLKKHLTTHEGAADQVCQVCGQQFQTPEHLQQHKQTQHQDDSVKEYKMECQHCGKKYIREEAYKQHLSGAPYTCSMCQMSVGCETKLKTHVRNEHGVCVCEFCGKSFKKNSLIHHIKIVHRESCVPCPHCPKKFTYRSKMLAHVDANHSQDKKYKCDTCGYMARTVSTLNLHHRRHHQDPSLSPQYGCELCTRKFYLPSKLTLHYRVHTGEKPFPCQSCGKTFATKYNRAEHERCVHGERMLVSHPDGSSSVQVIKHRRAPRAPGRRCELCGLDLPTSWAMIAHMKDKHNAQTLPPSPPEQDTAVATLHTQDEGEMSGVMGEYEVTNEQCEGEEQDLLLTSTPDVVNIPEYATHVQIDGVEYQVLRH